MDLNHEIKLLRIIFISLSTSHGTEAEVIMLSVSLIAMHNVSVPLCRKCASLKIYFIIILFCFNHSIILMLIIVWLAKEKINVFFFIFLSAFLF